MMETQQTEFDLEDKEVCEDVHRMPLRSYLITERIAYAVCRASNYKSFSILIEDNYLFDQDKKEYFEYDNGLIYGFYVSFKIKNDKKFDRFTASFKNNIDKISKKYLHLHLFHIEYADNDKNDGDEITIKILLSSSDGKHSTFEEVAEYYSCVFSECDEFGNCNYDPYSEYAEIDADSFTTPLTMWKHVPEHWTNKDLRRPETITTTYWLPGSMPRKKY